ncbi:MAG: type I restriction-modification system subunit M [Coriobacteriia bacterium]|nr:type I restriction-modification system subunit M [Coriobacteriia bacterium]
MNKQQLSAKIWAAANRMRSKMDANEYKDFLLGFIFYKFLSDKELEYIKSMGAEESEIKEILDEDNKDEVVFIQEALGYFIPYEHLYNTWLESGQDFNIAHVHEAISSFDRNLYPGRKKLFADIFRTLNTGLSRLGENASAQTKAVRNLLDLISDMPTQQDNYDILGFVYEELISKFAENAGKKAGEFYTPHEVSSLMSEIVAYHLKDREEIKIYDPTSGSGSLLLTIGRSIAKYTNDDNNIKYYAQEKNLSTYNLTRMNLIMRGINPSNIETRNGDTLEDDWPWFDDKDPQGTYEPLYVDAVVSNPPYSQNWEPDDKEADPRYARFGLAPRSKADYAFLLHDLYHLQPDGIMAIILPHGVLFRGGEEEKIRRNLIEYNHIEAIIGLPPNIFYGTGIPTIIMVLKQKRTNTDVLIIDASKNFKKVGKSNVLRASDIKRISDTVNNRLETPKYSKLVSLEEIRDNSYNLNIPRYVDSSEDHETWDIYASMFGGIPKVELDALDKYWKAFPQLKKELFQEISSTHVEMAEDSCESILETNDEIRNFKHNFNEAFNDLGQYLHEKLIVRLSEVNTNSAETEISEEITKRLKNIPLIDEYEAFQVLDDNWITISNDIESLKTDLEDLGWTALTLVDPLLVTKTKNGKSFEVQEGWKGRYLPFELVQKHAMSEDLENLQDIQKQLSQNTSEFEELFDNLTEEDKEDLSGVLNEDKNAFRSSELNKAVKIIKQDLAGNSPDEDSIEFIQLKASALLEEEKKLKREIKNLNEAIQKKTKEVLSSLSEEEATKILAEKWFKPLIDELYTLPEKELGNLTAKIKLLANKYSETLADIDNEIHETEKQLIEMIDQLTGSESDMSGLQELKSLLGGA